MRTKITDGPLTAFLRECWVLEHNKRQYGPHPGWTDRPTLHALVVESVLVQAPRRRQGYCRRLLASLCADPRFDLIVVEGVRNPVLAAALVRYGWECDPEVMDFYWTRPAAGVSSAGE